MPHIDPQALTLGAASRDLDAKKYSARELTEAVMLEATRRNTEINAYLEIFDDALEMADRADAMRKDGKATTLTGIPIAIKDNMLIAGKISSSASTILANHRATYDATVIRKLKDAGAVLLGRTNMDEFAMGSSSESSAFGPVRNPVDPTRVPGGSSGGSAAAVAMGGAIASLGSDTGGSIRQPASLTGLVGLKPTYGAVSRSGLMAMASSLDQIGPFAKTVDDAEVLFRTISGYDPLDSTSVPDDHAVRVVAGVGKKLTVGVPEAFIAMDGMDDDVREAFQVSIEGLRKAGHTIVPVELPTLPSALAVYYIIMPAEVSANLARFDGIRYGLSKDEEKLIDVYLRSRGEGFGREVRRRILLGTYVLSHGYYDAYYNKAVAVRRSIAADLGRAFTSVDVVATPTSPVPAFRLGEKTSDPLQMYLADIFTVPANIAGVPAISVPAGSVLRDGVRLPVGVQFMAAHFREQALFAAGRAIEGLSLA